MKRKILAALSLTLTVGLFVTFTSCNSSSKKQTKEEVTFNQEDYNKQLQGVFEYLPPNQGMSAMFGNHFIFVFGDSDTTMVCQGGTYTVSGEKVVYTTEYASDPELVGSTIKWSAQFLKDDNVKTIIYDDERNIINELYNIRKVKVDEQMLSQMKDWEGVYKYLLPRKAMGINFGGYIIAGGQMGSEASGTAATYEHKNDTVTVKRLFALDPGKKGKGFRWVNESMSGDTLNWATINSSGEVMSRGQSVYLK